MTLYKSKRRTSILFWKELNWEQLLGVFFFSKIFWMHLSQLLEPTLNLQKGVSSLRPLGITFLTMFYYHYQRHFCITILYELFSASLNFTF